MKERSNLESSINQCLKVKNDLEEITDLIELYENEKNESDELEKEILSSLEELSDKASILTSEAMLSGEADSNSAFIEFHPGAGGTESQDWAQMLL